MENLRDLLNYVHKTRWARQRTEEKSYAKARLFVDFVGASALCSSLEAADVRNYRAQLTGKASTINRNMRAVVTMLHDGIDMGWVPADALRGFKNLKEEKKEIQILESRDEVVLQKALSAKRHFGLLMTFLLNTGLRMQEALGLQWEAVTDSAVFLSAADTKGQADRTVPLTREASQTLNLLRVFGPKDGPFTDVKYQTFYKAWSAATERAGLAGLTPHGLRHTCCTRLIRKGVPLPVVQKWMGHESVETTMRYVHADKADLEAARDLLQG